MPLQPADPSRPVAPAPISPRPYTITAGRTVSRLTLPLEALVTAVSRTMPRTGQPEHDQILALCAHPISVAEVSALLVLPVGVARILLSDLSGLGLVSIDEPVGDRPTTALMERVLSGLQSI